jgi:putative ABC transport system ATP-binding protein
MGHHTINALDGVDCTIESGEFVSILGVSGSGKSTLLHLIGGLERPSTGQILVDGKELGNLNNNDLAAYRNQKVGFVFQQFNLIPTLTALENVALPLTLASVNYSERIRRASTALKSVGLAERIAHRPNELSGGELQRVAIARAIVNEPNIILADEPTGNLDSITGQGIVELLSNLNVQRGVSVIVATHAIEIASHASRKIRLADGKIIEDSSYQ